MGVLVAHMKVFIEKANERGSDVTSRGTVGVDPNSKCEDD